MRADSHEYVAEIEEGIDVHSTRQVSAARRKGTFAAH
jgi:hypothetical protein